jgi:hypothetical protein
MGLLLDQTILLHFRSSIDRPLNLPQYPGSNNYISIPEENSKSCSSSGTRRVNLVTNPVISREWRKGPGSAYNKWSISWSLSNNFISIRHMGLVDHPLHRRNDERTLLSLVIRHLITYYLIKTVLHLRSMQVYCMLDFY